MRPVCFSALLLCVLPGWVSASASQVIPMLNVSAGNVLESLTRYVASRVRFSGQTEANGDQVRGSLGLVGSDFVWAQHRFGINYQDSTGWRNGEDSNELALNYGIALSDIALGFHYETSDYSGVSVSSGNRFDSDRSQRAFKLTGTSPWFSWGGLNVSGVISHSVEEKTVSEGQGWEEDSLHQLSKFGIEARKERRFSSGLTSSASIAAFGGVDFQEVDRTGGGGESRDRFQKVALSASLSQEAYDWTFGLGGRYQLAGKDLPESEWQSIAGSSLAVGYNGKSRQAPEGGWLKLHAGTPKFQLPLFTAVRSSVTMSVLRGWTPNLDFSDERSGNASVGELSLRLASRDFSAAMSVGKILEASDGMIEVPTRPDLSLSFSVGL